MRASGRVERWLDDLQAAPDDAAALAGRGRAAFDDDRALQLAFEALSIRVGEIAKCLVTPAPSRLDDPIWLLAAKNRDPIAHHYDRVDLVALWDTVTQSLPALRVVLVRVRSGGSARTDGAAENEPPLPP